MAGKILKYLVLLALILLIISIGSFFFGGPSFRERDVLLEVQGPNQADVGDELTYKIKYANNTKVVLSNLEFSFSYPEGSVVLKDGEPISDLTVRFSEVQLFPGQSGEKEFKAFLVGERGDIKSAKVKMSYKAGSIRSAFEKESSTSATIVGVPITLTLVAPPNIVSGQNITYLLDYRNESQEDISDIRFQFVYPEGFTPQSYEPNPSSGNNTWNIPVLKKNGGSRISIGGTINGNEGEGKPLQLKLLRKIGDVYVDYERAVTTTIISNPLLGLSMTVNGSSNYSAYLGERLEYIIKYKNNSNLTLFGLTLGVKLEGDMYDFSNLNISGGFYDDSSKTITWNTAAISDFAVMSPNVQGEVRFTIKVKEQFTSNVPGNSRDRFVKATARLSTPNVPTEVPSTEVATTTSNITKISSQPSFNQLIYYNDPTFGSNGPMPPVVGQETEFHVHWQLSNPGNDISKAEIVATLPPGVVWKGITSTGQNHPEPKYNPNSSQIIWTLGNLSFGIGTLTPKYEVSFRVSVQPSSGQAGSPAPILKDVRFSGVDGFTGQEVVIKIPSTSTNTSSTVDKAGEGTVTR